MAAKYWNALDYGNVPPELGQAMTLVKRPFTAVVNSGGGAINGVNKITSLASTGPDIIALCTLPGNGYGICITDYYIDFGVLDTGTHALVFELGLLLTSTTQAAATSSLDTGSTTMANAGYFATLITPNTGGAAARMNPVALESNASTPAELACTYAIGALPLQITNQSGGNTGGNVGTYPNSGLYDLILQVTTSAGTVSATDAYIKGWVEYFTMGPIWQV